MGSDRARSDAQLVGGECRVMERVGMDAAVFVFRVRDLDGFRALLAREKPRFEVVPLGTGLGYAMSLPDAAERWVIPVPPALLDAVRRTQKLMGVLPTFVKDESGATLDLLSHVDGLEHDWSERAGEAPAPNPSTMRWVVLSLAALGVAVGVVLSMLPAAPPPAPPSSSVMAIASSAPGDPSSRAATSERRTSPARAPLESLPPETRDLVTRTPELAPPSGRRGEWRYWLRRVKKTGGEVETVADDVVGDALVMDATHAYWLERKMGKSPGRVHRVLKQGGRSEQVFEDCEPLSIAVDESSLYVSSRVCQEFCGPGAVIALAKNGSGARRELAKLDHPHELLVHEGQLYFIGGCVGERLYRVDPRGTEPPRSLYDLGRAPYLIDGERVYLGSLWTFFVGDLASGKTLEAIDLERDSGLDPSISRLARSVHDHVRKGHGGALVEARRRSEPSRHARWSPERPRRGRARPVRGRPVRERDLAHPEVRRQTRRAGARIARAARAGHGRRVRVLAGELK